MKLISLHVGPQSNVCNSHCHGIAGKAWSAFGKPLEMINQDVTYFYGDAQAVYQEFGGVVLNEEEGKKLAAALGPKGKGLILRNHGLLVRPYPSPSLLFLSKGLQFAKRWCRPSAAP